MSGTIEALGERGHRLGGRRRRSPSCPWTGTAPARPASPATRTSARTSIFVGIDSPGSLQELWNVPAAAARRAARRPRPRARGARRAGRRGRARRAPLGTGRRRQGRRHRRRPDRGADRLGRRHVGAEVVVIEPEPGRRAQIAELGFTTLDPRRDRPGRVGRGVDGRRRRRRGVRGVRAPRPRCSGRPRSPRCAARSSSSPSIRLLARSTCSGCSGASCASSARGSTSAATSRRAVELLAEGVIPADLLITRDRAARRDRRRPSPTSRTAAP